MMIRRTLSVPGNVFDNKRRIFLVDYQPTSSQEIATSAECQLYDLILSPFSSSMVKLLYKIYCICVLGYACIQKSLIPSVMHRHFSMSFSFVLVVNRDILLIGMKEPRVKVQ